VRQNKQYLLQLEEALIFSKKLIKIEKLILLIQINDLLNRGSGIVKIDHSWRVMY
jgi:hypothetical protein